MHIRFTEKCGAGFAGTRACGGSFAALNRAIGSVVCIIAKEEGKKKKKKRRTHTYSCTFVGVQASGLRPLVRAMLCGDDQEYKPKPNHENVEVLQRRLGVLDRGRVAVVSAAVRARKKKTL